MTRKITIPMGGTGASTASEARDNLGVASTETTGIAANTVRISQNSGSVLNSVSLNFVNTAAINVTVTTGTTGNANIAFFANSSNPELLGPTGPQGAAGVQGATGAQGAQGAVGAQGSAGVQGATGVQGDIGAQGAVGIQGSTGVQGAIGTQGAQGAQGAPGVGNASGTANYVAKFTAASSLGNSIIFDNGTNVSIGTNDPTNPLTIISDSSAQLRIGTVNPNIDARVTLAASGTGVNVFGGSGSAPIGIYSASTPLMYLTTGGNVGIGTTNFLEKFEVYTSTGSVNQNIRTDSSNASDRPGLRFQHTGGSSTTQTPDNSRLGVIAWMGVNSSGTLGNWSYIDSFLEGSATAGNLSTSLRFHTANSAASGSEKMRITSTGDFLVGTTSTGAAGVALPPTLNYSFAEGSNNSYANLYRQLNTAAAVLAHGYKRSSTGAFASSFGTSIARAAIAVGYNNGSIAFFSDSATNVANGTDITPTERMTILNSGNVGVGTTSPTARLNIFGTGSANDPGLALDITTSSAFIHAQESFAPNITSTQAVINVIGREGTTKNSGYIGYLYSGTPGSNNNKLTFGHWGADHLMVMDGAGNVGIGTTNPGSPLHVVTGSADSTGFNFETTGSGGKTFFAVHKLGFIRIRSSDTNGAAMHMFDNAGSKKAELSIGSDSKLNWYSDALTSNWLTFDGGNGRVGIGTTSPSAKLEVAGDHKGQGYQWIQKALPYFYFGAGGITDEYLVLTKYYDGGGAINSSGIMGEIIAARGSTTSGNSTCKTRLHITSAYLDNYCGEFSTTGSRDFYRIDIITIDGVKYYAARGRPSGGESLLGSYFTGWIITDNSDKILTRVRASDANVTVVTAGAFYPAQAVTKNDNKLYLETNNVDRLVIDNNGNVGIGTTNPTSKLHLYDGLGPVFRMVRETNRFDIEANTNAMGFISRDSVTSSAYFSGFAGLAIGKTGINYARLEVQSLGITAAAISTGWPAYNAEAAIQSQYVLHLETAGNGSVSTAGQGASVNLTIGGYYDSRGIITMIGAGGASPSDQGTGRGKDLMIKAGNSDNTNGYVGGRLFLAGGSGYSGGAFNANYGAVVLQPQGGSVSIGTSSATSKFKVDGTASVGPQGKLSFIGLDINDGGTPSFIKIITTIPFVSGGADFTVNIKGFVYGATAVADLSICWHYYNSTFYNPTVISKGSWAPTVRLSAEGGFVAIVLGSPGYWPKLYVESMYSSAYTDSYATGWSWVNADASGSPIVTVSYKSNFGNLFSMDTSGNVGINMTPVEKLDVTGNIRASGNVISISDERVKIDIETIQNALSKVLNLRGVSYTKKDSGAKQIGVIAQEVNKVIPEVVSYTETDDRYSVAYGNLVGLLIEAIKEQNVRIIALEEKLEGK